MVGISGAALERRVSAMPSAIARPADDMRIGRGDVDRGDRDLPGDEIDNRRRAAAIGDVHQVGAGVRP